MIPICMGRDGNRLSHVLCLLPSESVAVPNMRDIFEKGQAVLVYVSVLDWGASMAWGLVLGCLLDGCIGIVGSVNADAW